MDGENSFLRDSYCFHSYRGGQLWAGIVEKTRVRGQGYRPSASELSHIKTFQSAT